jgi:sugar lactone lactonase YvrE
MIPVDFKASRSSYLWEATLKGEGMRQEKSFRSEAAVITTGLAMGESPRWHDGKLWVSDWGAQEILAIDSLGHRQALGQTSFELPVCIDWLPNGSLLIVAGRENRVMRQEANGSLVTYANLRNISDEAWNEIVVDGRGNAYINGGSGVIALVKGDSSVRQVAADIAFPNGMAITPDNKTLIIAESYGRKLTAFDIEIGGSLSNRRVWADLGTGVPDGICVDAEQSIWCADVPNKCCVRVREGGEVLQTVRVDRGCFACMLGGSNRRTLFIVATEWRGMHKIVEVARNRTGQILSIPAPASGAGWP